MPGIILNGVPLTQFQDRGDPVAHDYVVGDLTVDGNWINMDLAALCGLGVKAVLISYSARNTTNAGVPISFRKNGNTNEKNIFIRRSQVANVIFDAEGLVACDDNIIVEYKVDNTGTWDIINIKIRSWFY